MSSHHCSSVCKWAKNWCNTEIQLHEAKYVWTISNFDFHEAEGSTLFSPEFSAPTNHQLKWNLKLKPNGETDAKDTVSFYIILKFNGVEDKKMKIYAKLSTSVLVREQNEVYNGCASTVDNRCINEYSFSPPKVKRSWGWSTFLKKNDIFRNNMLSNNNRLTIITTIIFSPVRRAFTNTIHSCNVAPLYPNLPACNLVENFEMLFENHEFADIVLYIKDSKKEYPAHKIILAARSSVFAVMFKHDLKEKETNRIEIEDMNEEVVAEMLRYIYTGKCENTEKLADGLLAAADKYDLDRLKMICAEALYKTLSVENAASILALADLHCVTELKTETMKFIVARFAEVVVSTTWNKVLASNAQLMNEVCQAVAGQSPAPKLEELQDTDYEVTRRDQL